MTIDTGCVRSYCKAVESAILKAYSPEVWWPFIKHVRVSGWASQTSPWLAARNWLSTLMLSPSVSLFSIHLKPSPLPMC